jgi:RNA polymerase sigma factor (sigma-70 family)
LTAAGEDSDELRELVQECRDRRPEAWERFFARYDHLVRVYVNFTARTTPAQDREDIRQKVWMRMPAILDRFDPAKGALAGYLLRSCRWAVFTEFRRFKRERQFAQPADETILRLVRESPEEQNPAILRVVVKDYLRNKVNDRAKLLIYMDWIDGMSYRQIMSRHRVSRAVAFRRFEECRLLVRNALGIKNNSQERD